MNAMDLRTERAERSLRRAVAAAPSACVAGTGFAPVVGSAATAISATGTWYPTTSADLRHDIAKSGGPRGTS